jgi:hypothetical protein
MTRIIWSFCILSALVLTTGTAFGQGKKNKKTEEQTKEAEKETVVAEPEPSPPAQESTVQDCTDGQDNDGDGHVDCDDQDCEIFAVCVKAAPPEPEKEPAKEEAPPKPTWVPESGIQCRDGKDNNGDGQIDCHEMTCQRYHYCRQLMYETPETPNKEPGLLVNIGFCVAFPNFRTPTATANSIHYGEVPFDPDMGGMLALKLGYMSLKWLGVGLNFLTGITGASNHSEFLETTDDPNRYKYFGEKTFGHIGGFLRLQWVFDRVVPYLDIAAGYSFMEYQWQIYDPSNDWDDISGQWDDGNHDDYYYYDEGNIVGYQDTNRFRTRHFTFALEPGIDFYVSKRRFAIGLNAWMPVVASNDSSTDNIGVMFNLTYMPMWREQPRLKPEYDVAMAK